MLLVLCFLFSCEEKIQNKKSLEPQKMAEKTEVQKVKEVNDAILFLLKKRNYSRLSKFVSPHRGVRFSMYAHVTVKTDKVFTKADFDKYLSSDMVFTWGERDGSGDRFTATLRNYLSQWVFAADYSEGRFSYNKFLVEGNSQNNLEKIYVKDVFTENYLPGTAQNSFMDWKVLRLVFEEIQGKYYLVAIVNDQWTI